MEHNWLISTENDDCEVRLECGLPLERGGVGVSGLVKGVRVVRVLKKILRELSSFPSKTTKYKELSGVKLGKKFFPYRESDPGQLGESQLS